MNKQNKNTKNSFSYKRLGTHLGIFLMSMATAISGLDINSHNKVQAVLLNRPVTAFQEENSNNDMNSIRRERDETAPHYISYSETQRTPSRSSKS